MESGSREKKILIWEKVERLERERERKVCGIQKEEEDRMRDESRM